MKTVFSLFGALFSSMLSIAVVGAWSMASHAQSTSVKVVSNTPAPIESVSLRTTNDPIHDFLTAVKNKSSAYRVNSLQEKIDVIGHEVSLSSFDWSGEASIGYDQSEDPQTSPFSSDSSRVYTLSAEIEKFWQNGLTTTAKYSLVDNLTTFPARADSDFISPQLSLGVSTSLFQDFLSEKWELVEPTVNKKKSLSRQQASVAKKTTLIKALLLLTEILEVSDDLKLQKDICQQIDRQSRKLSEKNKRGSVSRRDYLVSLKEVNACRANITSLEKLVFEKKQNLYVLYGIDEQIIGRFSVTDLFERAGTLFKSGQFVRANIDWNNVDELAELKLSDEILDLDRRRIEAENKIDLDLSVVGGLRGIDSDFAPSHEDLGQLKFPYVLATVTLAFPFKKRSNEIDLQVNRLQLELQKEKTKQLTREKMSRFDVLKDSLEKDFAIYQDYLANVSLSQSILNETRKDFNNGRVDFFDLTEFQKRVIESRRTLASLRTRIIINTIEYVDYFQFFKEYY